MPFPQGPFFAKLGSEDLRELAVCAEARGIDMEAAAGAALALERVAAECSDCVALRPGGVWAVGGGAGTALALDRAASECSGWGAESASARSEKKAWSLAGAALRDFLRWKKALSARARSEFSGLLRKRSAAVGGEACEPRTPEEAEAPCGELFDAGGVCVRGAALQNLEALCGGDPGKASAVLSRAARRLELLDSLAALGGTLGGTVRSRGRIKEFRIWEV